MQFKQKLFNYREFSKNILARTFNVVDDDGVNYY